MAEGAALRKVMEKSLAVIGLSALHTLFLDLQMHGILLEGGKRYSLKDVCKILNALFGAESSALMMERIYKELQV
jgi:hypothetical protein